MAKSNHADAQYERWERDILKGAIEEHLRVYKRRLFTAKRKGKPRKHGKDKNTKGVWIKKLDRDIKSELKKLGCRESYIENELKRIKAETNIDIEQLNK